VIIRGGENIPVAYIEGVLCEHSDIDAAAVVGVPGPRPQERARACIVLKTRATLMFEQMERFLDDKGAAKPGTAPVQVGEL
jgi:cyclohexanecarboxylate-CoA ligase